jgi:5-formyltetrahydrofolate cyclo-ligase
MVGIQKIVYLTPSGSAECGYGKIPGRRPVAPDFFRTLIMQKKDVRTLYREKRKALTDSQMEKWDDLILIHFQQLRLPFLQNCLSYYPLNHHREVSSFGITRYLSFRYPGLQIAYPRTDPENGTMKAIIKEEDTRFMENRYGIPEPEAGMEMPAAKIDLILIPLLAFDEAGHRVGYGKGFYDRFLAGCDADCIRIGLSHFDPIERLDDYGDHDVKLNFCITPRQVYAF